MNSKTFQYFINLEEKNLKKHNGVYTFDPQRMIKLNQDDYCSRNNISPCLIDDKIFCFKNVYSGHFFNAPNINLFASSKMYQDLGFVTPPVSPLYDLDGKAYTISEFLNTLTRLQTTLARQCLPRDKKKKSPSFEPGNFKWDILFKKDIQEQFLEIMTPECLDEIIALFLLGELRTDGDTHGGNYFLYKSKDSPLYEGIIPIDLEESMAIEYKAGTGADFLDFTKKTYRTHTPQQNLDQSTYQDRVKTLKNLIQQGTISQKHINLIKQLLEYNLPKTIKEISKKYHVRRSEFKQAYDPTAQLWQYNIDHLGRELGM